MNSRTSGWLALAFAAAAGIGTLPAGDTAAPAAKPPGAGDVAPAFSLAGSDGKAYTLAEFKGKKAVVVAWFPKAFTGG
jgi:peroxiredoxin Q/BCP